MVNMLHKAETTFFVFSSHHLGHWVWAHAAVSQAHHSFISPICYTLSKQPLSGDFLFCWWLRGSIIKGRVMENGDCFLFFCEGLSGLCLLYEGLKKRWEMPEGVTGSNNTTERENCGQQCSINSQEACRQQTHGGKCSTTGTVPTTSTWGHDAQEEESCTWTPSLMLCLWFFEIFSTYWRP